MSAIEPATTGEFSSRYSAAGKKSGIELQGVMGARWKVKSAYLGACSDAAAAAAARGEGGEEEVGVDELSAVQLNKFPEPFVVQQMPAEKGKGVWRLGDGLL